MQEARATRATREALRRRATMAGKPSPRMPPVPVPQMIPPPRTEPTGRPARARTALSRPLASQVTRAAVRLEHRWAPGPLRTPGPRGPPGPPGLGREPIGRSPVTRNLRIRLSMEQDARTTTGRRRRPQRRRPTALTAPSPSARPPRGRLPQSPRDRPSERPELR